jgi:hypothetical protein
MNQFIIEPLGVEANESGPLCIVPNKVTELIGAFAIKQPFSGSGGTAFRTARVCARGDTEGGDCWQP